MQLCANRTRLPYPPSSTWPACAVAPARPDRQRCLTLFRRLVGPARRQMDDADSAALGTSLADRLKAMSAAERERELLNLIRRQAAAVLGYDSVDAVGGDQEFKALGFDSLGAVEFRNRVKAATGVKLPTSAVFDHPTPIKLCQFLSQSFETAAADEPAPRLRLADVAADRVSTRHRGHRHALSGPSPRAGSWSCATDGHRRHGLAAASACSGRTCATMRFGCASSWVTTVLRQWVSTEVPELECVDFTGEADAGGRLRALDRAGSRGGAADGRTAHAFRRARRPVRLVRRLWMLPSRGRGRVGHEPGDERDAGRVLRRSRPDHPAPRCAELPRHRPHRAGLPGLGRVDRGSTLSSSMDCATSNPHCSPARHRCGNTGEASTRCGSVQKRRSASATPELSVFAFTAAALGEYPAPCAPATATS